MNYDLGFLFEQLGDLDDYVHRFFHVVSRGVFEFAVEIFAPVKILGVGKPM